MGEPTLAEITEWYRRSNIAEARDEPLYVTPEEYADLRRRFSAPAVPEQPGYRRTLDLRFLGVPVIIDAEKAVEQRAGGQHDHAHP